MSEIILIPSRSLVVVAASGVHSAACSLVQELCQRQRAQACLFEGFIFLRRSGFIEEDE